MFNCFFACLIIFGWMSWGILWLDATVNIFGHDDFQISINFLQLCFATWKQQSDHFRACFHNLFGESEAMPMLGLIIPHFFRQDFPEYTMHHKNVNYEFLHSDRWEQALFLSLCVRHCPSTSFTWFLPWPQVVSSHTFTYPYSAEELWRPTAELRFSLWTAVLSLILCPRCVGSPCTHSSVSSTQEVCWAPLQYLLPMSEPARKTGNSLKAVSWDNVGPT